MPVAFYINLMAMTSALAVSLVLVAVTAMGPKADQRTHRFFLFTVILNVLGILCEFTTASLLGRPGAGVRLGLQLCDWGSYAFSALMHVSFAAYLAAYLDFRGKAARRLLSMVALCSGASLLLAAVSQWTHLYSSFDEGNQYQQSSLFWVGLIPPVLSLLVQTGAILGQRHRLKGPALAALLAYTLVPLASTAVEIAVGGLWLSYFAAAITLFLVHLNLQMALQRHSREQEMALAESRMALMVSQIQPHFLFNSLSAITQLCGNEKARQALATFAGYLRVNMDSLSRKEPVPFSWELAHVREYLWLEGLRFEERLNVVYHIHTDQFQLPVLTVQPLVENAVRYGITKKPKGGTLTISTEETPQGYRITVADDGLGFDPQAPPEDGRSHTGLANVRLRLAAMCGGTLQVESAPGQGTTATIIIPKQGEKGHAHTCGG